MPYDKNYLLLFLASFVVAAILVLGAGFYAEPLTGDLTRVGGWTEHDFGFRQTLPEVPIEDNVQDPNAAGILVLGDSFSMANIWQSVVSTDLRLGVASYYYEQFGCVARWIEMLEKNGYLAGKVVIVEGIERRFVFRFGNIMACRKTQSLDEAIPKPSGVLKRGELPTSQRTGEYIPTDLDYLSKTVKNAVLLAGGRDKTILSGVTVNAPLSSTRLFSNRRSDRILYTFDDDFEIGVSAREREAAVLSIQDIHRRIEAAGGRFLFVLVPNKSSVYADFIVGRPNVDRYTPIIRRLRDAGVAAVDLLTPFREHIEKEVDFYLPDDTHVSTKGYRVLGQVVADAVRQD